MANQPLNEQQLQALLRLKRHEQPPPGYFDDLLHSVQRRQREEMLRRPAWKLMAERVGTFFASLRKDWAYSAAMATVLVVGIAAIQFGMPRKQEAVAGDVPKNSTTIVAKNASTFEGTPVTLQLTPNGVPRANRNLREVKTPRPGPPRFIIDAAPPSYDPQQIRF